MCGRLGVGRTFCSFTVALALIAGWAPAAAHAAQAPPPGPPGSPPPYPAYSYGAADSNLRFDVKPKSIARTASVYVDGYLAGLVDDFDGVFQRLHVAPGEHDIVVYLDGYRSLRQHLYLSPNATRKIEGTLEHLSPSEPLEGPPVPSFPPGPPDRSAGPPNRAPYPRRGGPPLPPPPGQPPDGPQGRPEARTSSRFGALAVQAQPAGVDLMVDGTHWDGPSGGDERVVIQLPEGRHRVQVRKEGYVPFEVDVEIRRGETAPLNVSLAPSR